MYRLELGARLNCLFVGLLVMGFLPPQLYAAGSQDVGDEWSFSSLEATDHTIVDVDIEAIADQVDDQFADEEGPLTRELIDSLSANGIKVGDIVTLIPVEAPSSDKDPEWVKWHRLYRVANFLRAKVPSTWINNLVIVIIGLGATFLWAQPWFSPEKTNVIGGLIDSLGVIPLILLPNVIVCIDEQVNKAPPGKDFKVVRLSR
jgi:hypothetical protein